MSKTASELAESKLKRGLSIRLDPEPLAAYEECVAAAGLTVTGALRTSVLSMLNIHRQLNIDGLRVSANFTAKPQQGIDHFPELLGSVIFDVKPPAGLTVEQLHRLVFVIPEFIFDKGYEPYRIDSAHFQRIVYNGREVVSDRVTRNVLSFRLINGAWRASIFDYGSGLAAAKVVQQIVDGVEKTITAAIACYFARQLPDTRILSLEEVSELNAAVLPHLLSR